MIDVLPIEISRRLWDAGWRPMGEHLSWVRAGVARWRVAVPKRQREGGSQVATCSPLQALDWLERQHGWKYSRLNISRPWCADHDLAHRFGWTPSTIDSLQVNTATELVADILEALEAESDAAAVEVGNG